MKNLKNKLIGAVVVCAFAPLANASHFHMDSPYIGAEAIQTNQNYKSGWGKNVFRKDPMDYSFFAGSKFYKNFGAEIGYEFAPNRKTTKVFPVGSLVTAGTPSESAATLASQIKATHPYLGLFAEYDHHFSHIGKIKLQAMLGASATRINARYTVLTNAGLNTSIGRDFTKTKIVPMVKLSATYMATDRFGVRLSANYRNTASFKSHAKENTALQLRMKDTFGVGLGVTYSFK